MPKTRASDRLKAATDAVNLPRPDAALPKYESPDVWQIITTGNMDPRQHTPQWYHLIGCLNDQELRTANESAVIVSIPPQMGPMQANTCQFDAGPFAIIAVQDKWSIQTVTGNNRSRMMDVASIVFSKLNEIHIGAYGINRLTSINLRSITAKRFLSDEVATAHFGLPKGKAECEILYKLHLDDGYVSIRLSPSPIEDKKLEILYNRHHQIQLMAKSGYFDLGKFIKENAESDWKSASAYIADLIECVARADKD